MPLDSTVTEGSENPVKSSGIWNWVKSLLPDWLNKNYAEPATTASVSAEEQRAKAIELDLRRRVESLGTSKADKTTTYTKSETDAAIGANVENSVTSTSTTKALSANMGKELQAQITNLKQRGRYLSIWNCVTGLAKTEPTVNPYAYKAGDYFIVGTVGAINYRPSGTEYDKTISSTTVETGTPIVNDTYYFDGASWSLLHTEQPAISWESIPNKPSEFPPSTHTHSQNDVTGLVAALQGKRGMTDLNFTFETWVCTPALPPGWSIEATGGGDGMYWYPHGPNGSGMMQGDQDDTSLSWTEEEWGGTGIESYAFTAVRQTVLTKLALKTDIPNPVSPSKDLNPGLPADAKYTGNMISFLNDWLESVANSLPWKANREEIPQFIPEFATNKTGGYTVGEFCSHLESDGLRYLYQCTVAHTGVWNATHFTRRDVLALFSKDNISNNLDNIRTSASDANSAAAAIAGKANSSDIPSLSGQTFDLSTDEQFKNMCIATARALGAVVTHTTGDTSTGGQVARAYGITPTDATTYGDIETKAGLNDSDTPGDL